jgi:hypothetical protein
MKDVGLLPNHDYTGCRVEIEHVDEGWVPLVKTSEKVLWFENSEGNIRKIQNLDKKLKNVSFDAQIDDPINLKTESESNSSELLKGLKTNHNYVNDELEVNHTDKGWFPLVKTSKKVLYYLENGKQRKMSLKKFGGYRHKSETPSDFDERVDTLFDFDYDKVG